MSCSEGQQDTARYVINRHHQDQSGTALLDQLPGNQMKNARIAMMDRILGSRVAINLDTYIKQVSTRTSSMNSIELKLLSTWT